MSDAPELRFVNFEIWLDRYIEALPHQRRSRVAGDLERLRGYYFHHNDDPGRLAAIEAHIRSRGD